MYKQSNEAKLAYQSAERTLDIVVNVNGVDYKATDIEQFDYDSGGYTGDTFSIGSTYENNITVKFIHLVEGLKRGMIVKPRIGIKLPNGTFEYTPLGVFIIADEIQMDRNNNSTTIKAYDKFVVMEGQYISKLTYPANAVDIITEIAQMCKVDVNTNDLAHLPTIKVSKAITKQSYRTAIGWIAQLYVGFASFDRDGKLTIRRVAEPNYTIEPSEYEQQGLVKNEAPYIIGGISCNVNVVETTNNGETNETTHKLHSGSVNGSQIELTNDIMTQELLDSIWNSLKAVTFYPFSLNWFGNPAIEAGDWLSLKDMKGNVFVVPNNGYTISFNGGLSSTSKADQNATDSSTVKYTGELTRAIENYSRRQAPDGTNIYTDVKEPTDAKFNDVWFKPNGNSTELWIFERQSDGTGKWVKQPVNGEVEQKINDALKDFDELDKSFKNNANTQSATNELMKSRIDSISNQIPNLSDEISRVNGSVTSLKTQTDKDRQQLQSTSQNLDQARQDLLSNSDRIDKLSIQTDKDRQQLQTTSQNLDKARQDVLSNSSRIDKLSVGLDNVNINVNNVNSKVDNIKVGGTNLAKHTSNTLTNRMQVSEWVFVASGGNVANFNLDNYKGQTLTMRAWIDKPTVDAHLQVWTNASNNGYAVGNTIKAGQSGYSSLTFKVPSSFTTWNVAIGNGKATELAYKEFKVEKGTIATDWSPAPEDEIERVAQLRVDLNGMNATVATNKGDIAQIKLTENGMQQSIKDAQGNISTLQNDSKQFKQQFQDVNGNITTIKNDAKSLSSQLSTKVGTSEYNSFKEQTAQELRTKLIASDLNGYAKSADVKVSVDGLNARFDNLNVGGVNLVRNSAHDPINLDHWTTNGVGNVWYATNAFFRNGTTKMFLLNNPNTDREMLIQTEYIDIEPDTDYTLSMIVFGASGVSSGDIYYNIKYADGSNTYFNVDGRFKYNPYRAERKVYHFHTSPNSSGSKATQVFIRVDNNGLIPGHVDGTSMLGDVKLEKGTIATDWSPAPEDEIERVSQLRVDLNGMNATVATNKGDIAQIKLTETGMQQSIKDAQGNISTLQNDSKQFKQQFLDVNGNITTIKNDAKSLSSQLSTKVGTSEYNSFKEQTAQELRTKLIASDLNGYAKSADVKVSVDGLNARFDNLNVGGTNMVRNGAYNSDNTEHWTTNGVGKLYVLKHAFFKNSSVNHFGLANNTSNEMIIYSDWIDVQPNTSYTLSYYRYGYGSVSSGDTYIQFKHGDGATRWQGVENGYKFNPSYAEYKKFTFRTDGSDKQLQLRFDNNGGGDCMFAAIKLEKGTIASDYSPNPEDELEQLEVLSGKITANSNEFSTVYTKITNAKNDAINAIKGDSQWQSIGKIVTNASFLQNSDGFAQEVVKTTTPMVSGGGVNLVPLSSNPQLNDWNGGTVGRHAFWKNGSENIFMIYNRTSNEKSSSSPRFKVNSNQKYTISFYGAMSGNTVNYDVIFLGRKNGEKSDYTQVVSIVNKQRLSASYMEYKQFIFNVGNSDEGYIRFDNNGYTGGSDDSVLLWTCVKVEKGTVATPYSPAPEDLATKLQLNQVIDTADSHTRTISDYLTGSNSRFVQMANYLNMNVKNSSVSINGDGVMLSGNRIKITGKTLIDNAVILDALIKDINANTVKTKELDASKINVTNLNANNITTGTISGTNLNINLDSGDVSFQKGVLYNNKNFKIDLTNGFLEIQDAKKTRGLLIDDGCIYISKDLSSIDADKQFGVIGFNAGEGIMIDAYKVGKLNFYYSEIMEKVNVLQLETKPVNWVGKEYGGPELYMHAGETQNTHTFAIRTNGDGLGASILGDNDKITITASDVSISKIKNTYIENLDATNLHVYGSKNSVVPSSKGYIAINAYETAEYYFGDIGESQTDKQGIKIINLEPLFLETVNTNVPYQVFLSSYDDAKVWVFARNNNMFIVKSDKPNVKFAWEIKAKRKDYENVRLETVDLKNERN